ncbi:BTAD domain-containing putative transcriptional regulator [Microlunatus flavus]|uniref:Transcriptional regulatory protein, C terminal n=1 Tax=Microlunatus flavus TaxID=1036181 RepID=A0A1H8YZP9_9ACTN|nr:BTAD domain-containing putative transcriptional regulator [Microlunatus flavus]SEP57670.1 Transcriptional regulatory protein, C terminal [Microlunatus flavus]
MALAYGLLGPLTVSRDGRPLDLGAPKQRLVLALLLLERGRVVSTDRLVAAAWPRDAPPSAVPSLQAYLSNLRRLLREPDVDGSGRATPLVRQAPGYRLDVTGSAVDLDDYLEAVRVQADAVQRHEWRVAVEAGDRARSLWRGPLLADLADEDRVQAEATALDERRARSLADAVLAHAATGDLGTALEVARALAEEHPWRDDVAGLLVRVLARAGRTTEALEAYRAYADGLADELGLDPGQELRALHQAVLRGDAALAAWPEGSVPAPAVSSVPSVPSPSRSSAPQTRAAPAPGAPPPAGEPASPRPADRFVGRAGLLAALADVLAQGRSGRTAWAVLTGPPGIGKTRLAQEAVHRAEATGARAVWGRCLEEEGAPAWWPWRAVVRALGADPAVLLAPPAGADADAGRFLVYERLEELLRSAASRAPLVIVLDDLQWADATSLAALASLAVTLHDADVAVLATLRDGERRPATEDALRRALGAVGRAPDARDLALGPLDAADVAAMVGTVSGEALSGSDAASLAERTGGNPLFVREYARLPAQERLGAALPGAVRAVLGRRLEVLEPAVLDVVRAAAVIGERVDLPLLGRVVRLDPERAADLLDGAADEAIIGPTPGGTGYGFTHALLRDEVLAGLSPIRRQRLHLRVADVLADAPSTSTEEPLARRAHHLVAALPLADVRATVQACRAAARRAEEQWSYETAAQWWETALAAWDSAPHGHADPDGRDALLVAQVAALARSGRGQTLLDLVESSLAEVQATGTTATVGRLCSALLRSAGAWPWTSGGDDPLPLLGRLASLERFVEPDPVARVRLLAAMGVGQGYNPDPRVADGLTRGALALAEEVGDVEALADALVGRILTYVGVASHAEECEALLARLHALDHAQRDVDGVLLHTVSTMSRTLLGDVAGAERHLAAGAAEADRLRLRLLRAQLRWAEFGLATWHGAGDAQHLLDGAIEAHRRTELYELGIFELATNLLGLDTGHVVEWPQAFQVREDLTWAAVRAAFAGDRDRADALVAERLTVQVPTVWLTLGHLTVLANVVADLGLVHHAPALVEQLLPDRHHLAMVGQVASCGPVALPLARLSTVLGDVDAAAADLALAEDMVARNQGGPVSLRCALARFELDLARGGQPEGARLGEVAAQAERLGLRRLVIRAAELGARDAVPTDGGASVPG